MKLLSVLTIAYLVLITSCLSTQQVEEDYVPTPPPLRSLPDPFMVRDNTFGHVVKSIPELLLVVFKNELDIFVKKPGAGASKLNLRVGLVDVHSSKATTARLLVVGTPTIFHVSEGKFRPLPNHFSAANLTSYFDNDGWEQIAPRPSYLEPTSFLGKSLANTVGAVVKTSDHIQNLTAVYPPYVVYGVIFLIPVLILFLVLVFMSGDRRAPATQSKKRD